MSGAWGVACFMLGIVFGFLALMGAVVAVLHVTIDRASWRWVAAALAMTAGFATMATVGRLSVNSAASASRHRECFTVTGVDSGEGFGHAPMLFTTAGALEGTEDVVTRFRPGQHVCLVVANDPGRGDPVVVGAAK